MDDYDKAMADVVDAVKMMVSSWCHADSPKAMPERAQRINGHNNYRCVLPKGHEGNHRWPRDGRIVEWPQSTGSESGDG